MKVQSAIAATATAGDLTMAQMIARGVTQSEMNRMWQEMLEEVECLQSLSLNVMMSRCTLWCVQRNKVVEEEAE